jgi:hypothetical protein
MSRLARVTLVLLPFALGLLAGCASLQRVGKRTLDCSAPALAEQARAMAPTVLDALAGSSADWAPALDRLLLSAGDVAVCAVRAVVAELEARPQGGGPGGSWSASYIAGPDRMAETQQLRARRWLELNGADR